jgi:APA family basic amino acid/polyamine antiporter
MNPAGEPSSHTSDRPAAVPKLGFRSATALVVGNIIGGGVFLLPASLAPIGYNAVISWIITLTGALCLAYVFAVLGRRLPDAGGAHGFMRLALGDGAAFIGSWGYWLSVWTANAAIATSGASYLTELLPVMRTLVWAPPAAAIGLLWGLTLVNLLGIRAVAGVQVVTTLVKVVPIVAIPLLLLQRLWASGTKGFTSFDPSAISIGQVSSGVILTLYAMLGLESAAVPADRIRDPERNIPRSTLLGTGFTGILTMTACCAVIALLPARDVGASQAPLSLLLSGQWGAWAGTLVAVCATVSAYGALNGWVLLSGEVPAAMATRVDLPVWLVRRDARGVARGAVLLGTSLSSILIAFSYSGSLSGVFTFAGTVSTATCLALYLFCSIGAVTLMRRGMIPASPGLSAAAIGAVLFSLIAFFGAGGTAVAWGLALLAVGWPVYRHASRHARGRHGRAGAHTP